MHYHDVFNYPNILSDMVEQVRLAFSFKKLVILTIQLNIVLSFIKYTLTQSNILTRNVCITKYAHLYKLSNGIMVMTPK